MLVTESGLVRVARSTGSHARDAPVACAVSCRRTRRTHLLAPPSQSPEPPVPFGGSSSNSLRLVPWLPRREYNGDDMSAPKNQHVIPRCYLKQFVDPHAPAGQEPYVWIFERHSKKGKKKAPKNILTETDVYTFEGKDAGKNCVLRRRPGREGRRLRRTSFNHTSARHT